MIYRKELDLQQMLKLNKLKIENVIEDENISLVTSEDNSKHKNYLN
ncbi:hypothetical protein AAAC51_28605 [Priestia megaterium]